MAQNEEEPRSSFKVVDRRRFTSEGELRKDAPPDRPPPPPAPPAPEKKPAAPATAAGAAPKAPPQGPPKAAGPAGAAGAPEETDPAAGPEGAPPDAATELFLGFIQSLGQQALMQLGLVPYPDTGLVEQSLPMARQTIDIIAVVALKTRGNLNPQEARFLDMLLQDLRMAYVQVTEKAMKAAIPPELRKGGPGPKR